MSFYVRKVILPLFLVSFGMNFSVISRIDNWPIVQIEQICIMGRFCDISDYIKFMDFPNLKVKHNLNWINLSDKNVNEIGQQFEGNTDDTNTERAAIPRPYTLADDTQKLTNAVEGRTTSSNQVIIYLRYIIVSGDPKLRQLANTKWRSFCFYLIVMCLETNTLSVRYNGDAYTFVIGESILEKRSLCQ